MRPDVKLQLDLLTDARHRLDAYHSNFICYALEHACNKLTAPLDLDSAAGRAEWDAIGEAASTVHDYVLKGLGRDSAGDARLTVNLWLVEELGAALDPDYGYRKVNDGFTPLLARLAWVDRMIHQLNIDGTLP